MPALLAAGLGLTPPFLQPRRPRPLRRRQTKPNQTKPQPPSPAPRAAKPLSSPGRARPAPGACDCPCQAAVRAGQGCGTGRAGHGCGTGRAGDGGTGGEAAGSPRGAEPAGMRGAGRDAEPGTDTCTHTHTLENEGKYLGPLRLLQLPPIPPQPRRASTTLPVLHVPTPRCAARPSSPPPVGFGPRCLLAFWQPRRSSDGMCPLFFFFLSPFHNPSSPAFSAGASGAACGASSQGNWQRARHRDPPAADGALPGAGSPSASHQPWHGGPGGRGGLPRLGSPSPARRAPAAATAPLPNAKWGEEKGRTQRKELASPCSVAGTHQGPLPSAKASWAMSSSLGGGSGACPRCRRRMERLSPACPNSCPQPRRESPSQAWQAPPQTGDAAWRGRLPQTHLLPSIRLLHRGAREIGKGRAEEGLVAMGGGFWGALWPCVAWHGRLSLVQCSIPTSCQNPGPGGSVVP